MKRRKLNKKAVIVLSVILLIIIIEIINPIKLYNKHLLKELNYQDASIKTILNNNLKKEVLNQEYSKALDTIFASSDFKKDNYSIYKDLEYVKLKDYTKNINALIKKGYKAEEINNITRSATDASLKEFLEKDYIENINDYLKYDFAILSNYDRYVAYQKENTIDKELVVVYVNIGLDNDFYTNTRPVTEFSYDMLVNKYTELSEDFVPENLVDVPLEYAADNKQKAEATMLEAFKKMSDDCKAATGYKALVRSAYRDYKKQQDTYDLYLDAYGKKYAENYVAHPGFSEHQTGLAVDIKAESSEVFKGTKESEWIRENAYKYGFIFRYDEGNEEITGVKYESWHYRYVGVELAKDVHDKNMTYDEYYIRFLNK